MTRKRPSMLLRITVLGMCALLLAACAGMAGQGRAVALYDLSMRVAEGNAAKTPAVTNEAALPFFLEGIHAPTWLDNPTMQYRLVYAEPDRRYAFAESRWVATPTELIEAVLLRRQIVHRGRGDGQTCQLRLDVDEFVQRFDTASTSQSILEVRATLMARRDARVLARKNFTYSHTAGPDARGGVAAHAAMVGQLSTELAQWLVATTASGSGEIRECRAEKL